MEDLAQLPLCLLSKRPLPGYQVPDIQGFSLGSGSSSCVVAVRVARKGAGSRRGATATYLVGGGEQGAR